MSAATHSDRSPVAGFSLVEALVAMALMGLVLTGLALVTAQWLPNWQRGLTRVQQSELLALAIDRIVADLAAAEFVPANIESKRPLFEGSELSVTFVRSALGPNARPGLEIVRLSEASNPRPALVRSTALFAPRPPDAAPPRFADPIALVSSLYRVSFSYAGRDGVWRSDWIDAEELPRAIRLVVRDAATSRTLGASTATVIHTELPMECVTEESRRGCSNSAAAKDGDAAKTPPPQGRQP
jgi:general secretion pathway protein J